MSKAEVIIIKIKLLIEIILLMFKQIKKAKILVFLMDRKMVF